jgi:hypothetical protein
MGDIRMPTPGPNDRTWIKLAIVGFVVGVLTVVAFVRLHV